MAFLLLEGGGGAFVPTQEKKSRFGETDITLSFYKRGGPLRNGKEPILVTINLPEYLSDQAVELAFSNFGEVI